MTMADEVKQSKLHESDGKVSTSKPHHPQHIISLFRDASFHDKCDTDCPSRARILYAMDYYQTLRTANSAKNARDLFIAFCDSVYSAALLLDDYVHLMCKHSDSASLSAMAAQLKSRCAGPAKCEWTQRHFGRDAHSLSHSETETEFNFFIATMDTLHFNVFHLRDVGLRIDLSDLKTDDDDSSLVDAAMLRIRDIIRLKRKQFAFDRMDGADAKNKFTIDGGTQKQTLTQKGIEICSDSQIRIKHLKYGQRTAAAKRR